MKREFSFTVDKEDESLAIRKLLKKHLDFSSRLFAKLRHQELVFLNGKVLKGYMRPVEGDVIRCVLPEEKSHFEPEDIPVVPAFEDDDLLVIDKPAGYTVHPTKGHPVHTMANGIMHYMQQKGESFKIRFVNRLDMDTTGLLIVGKNSNSQDALVRDMEAGRVEKRYTAVVLGIPEEDEFTIDLPIGQPDPDKVGRKVAEDGSGRPSVTHVRVLEKLRRGGFDAAVVELKLDTGRTHQIRVHMSHIGHPLLGDTLYGQPSELIGRQALHASYLRFRHPASKEIIELRSDLPEDMRKALLCLRDDLSGSHKNR